MRRIHTWRCALAATPRLGVAVFGLCWLLTTAVCGAPHGAGEATVEPVDRADAAYLSVGSYAFTKQFDIAETSNQQGLAYGGGFLWVRFDTGSGEGRIFKYGLNGVLHKRSPDLPLGHCAEIAYRTKDGTLYAVDYVNGGSVAHVRVVDMSLTKPTVVKTFDVTGYGLAGMVAIDNSRDQLLVFGGSSPYRFNFFALAGTKAGTTLKWLRQVKYRPGLGLPQGLEVIGGEFLFSTTNFAGGAIIGNRVHVFDLKGGYKTYIDVPISRESEGLAINPTNNVLYLGFHKQNSVYVMSSAYHACPEAACFVRRMV